MTPIILCLLSLAAIALWLVYSTMSHIRALVTALGDMVVYLGAALLGYFALEIVFHLVIIIFGDISMLWELIKELLSGIGGLIVAAIVIGVVIWLGSFIWSIVVVIAEVLFYIAAGILGIVLAIFEFIEEKSRDGYSFMVTKITQRLERASRR